MDGTVTTETAAAEETTPEQQAVNTEAPEQGTDPKAATPAEGEDRPEDGNPTGEGQEEVEAVPAFTVPVKYNRQYRELTPEEAGSYAQKGMKYEALEPQLAKIRYLGSKTGQSIETILDNVYKASEDVVRKQMLDKVSGDEQLADELMQAWRLQDSKGYDDMLAAEAKALETEAEDNNKRLAAEFAELCREFPDIAKVEDVPKAVMQAAVRSGRDLLSEYLLHTHKEAKRMAQAEAQQAAAEKASAGSQAGGTAPTENPEIAAMRRGVWQ